MRDILSKQDEYDDNEAKVDADDGEEQFVLADDDRDVDDIAGDIDYNEGDVDADDGTGGKQFVLGPLARLPSGH